MTLPSEARRKPLVLCTRAYCGGVLMGDVCLLCARPALVEDQEEIRLRYPVVDTRRSTGARHGGVVL